METPVLTVAQQRKSLSSIKKRKKQTVKNILCRPNADNNRKPELSEEEGKYLSQALSILLPCAKLPVQPKKWIPRIKKEAEATEIQEEDCSSTQINSESKNLITQKRSQLLLGVNAVSRGVQNDIACAALFANDVKPFSLISHLTLLFSHKQIPFLLLPNLRQITQDSLGFPCIVIGFKKNFSHFTFICNLISEKYLAITLSNKMEGEKITEVPKTIIKDDKNPMLVKKQKQQFVHKFRSSNKERAFIPELFEQKVTTSKADKEATMEFIPVGLSNKLFSSVETEDWVSKKVKNVMGRVEILSNVEKKKLKRDWVIDNLGQQSTNNRISKYKSPKMIKVQSNINRLQKKRWIKNKERDAPYSP